MRGMEFFKIKLIYILKRIVSLRASGKEDYAREKVYI